MTISEIQFVPIKPKDGCIGFVSFVLDEQLYCGSIAVYSRFDGGIRLVWPKINNKGHQFPTCHPIARLSSDTIERAVFEKIRQLMPV